MALKIFDRTGDAFAVAFRHFKYAEFVFELDIEHAFGVGEIGPRLYANHLRVVRTPNEQVGKIREGNFRDFRSVFMAKSDLAGVDFAENHRAVVYEIILGNIKHFSFAEYLDFACQSVMLVVDVVIKRFIFIKMDLIIASLFVGILKEIIPMPLPKELTRQKTYTLTRTSLYHCLLVVKAVFR